MRENYFEIFHEFDSCVLQEFSVRRTAGCPKNKKAGTCVPAGKGKQLG